MMAAACGIENNLGNLITPLRACFNRAEDEFLSRLPDLYVQVVLNRNAHGQLVHTGVYVGDDLDTYLAAARHSREVNVTVLDEPIERIVCVMQGDEFFSTWVANKAIYRTRMALADGGELIIIAPGLKRFGEQADVDALIRKYGYCGTERVMEQYRANADMQDLAHATAHLIHGSTEGRFKVTYAPGHLTKEEIEGVGYQYADIGEVVARYQAAASQRGLESDRRRRKILLHPDALRRLVGDAGEAARSAERVRRGLMALLAGAWVALASAVGQCRRASSVRSSNNRRQPAYTRQRRSMPSAGGNLNLQFSCGYRLSAEG